METRQFKLSQLAEAAGVAGKTIHYYMREGILPPARKVREKLALYDENHLRLLKLVQKLQTEKKLPLAFIAQLFKQGNYDAETLELSLVADMFERANDGKNFFPSANRQSNGDDESSEATISPALQRELASAGLIDSADGPLTGEEGKIAWIISNAQAKGVSLGFFRDMMLPVQAIVSRQTRELIRTIDGEANFREVVKQVGEIDELVNRFLKAEKTRTLRHHFERSFAEGPLSVEKLRKKIYVPSSAFLEKHEIFGQIEELEARVDTSGRDSELEVLLAEAYLAIGRYEEGGQLANRVLKRDKKNIDAMLLVTVADTFLNRTDEAVQMAQRAYKSSPGNARVTAYAAMAHIMQAARVGGVISPAQWLRKALDLFQESLKLVPRRTKDRLEILLMKGRAYSILPSPLEQVDEGIMALEELLEIVDSHSEAELGLPFKGFNEIYRVNTFFYLGEAFEQKKDPEQFNAAFEKVLIRDPSSNFGRYAYQRISS